MAKLTTITIETSSFSILYSRKTRAAWCPMCGAEVQMIDLSSLNLAVYGQWLESGEVHRSVASDGLPLICLNALLARVQTTKPASCGLPRLPNTKKERI